MHLDKDELFAGDELDELIDSALRGEPMRQAPIDLHRKVTDRIRIAALRDREVVRFRYSMMSLLVAFLGAVIMASVVIVFTNFSPWLNNGVPGGAGIYDHYAVSMWQSWSGYTGAYTLVVSIMLAGGTMALGLIPLRRYRRSHQEIG